VLAPVGILLLAFALRLIALQTRPVWYDEAFAVFLAEKDFAAIAAGTAADTMPPLYYTLLHVWMLLVGVSPFALRMLSVAISMLIVALMYALGTRALSSVAGLFAALFAALAPLQIYHAQEMRMYAPLAFGSLLFLYGVLCGVDDRTLLCASADERGERKTSAPSALLRARLVRVNPRPIILIALGTAIALYSHNLAFVTLLAANVYLAWRRDWYGLAKLSVAQFVGVLAFAPWLFYVPTQIAKIQRAFWTQPPALADVLQMLVVFTAYLPLPSVIFAGALFVSIAVAVIAALEMTRWIRRCAPRSLGMLLTFVFVSPALAFALSYLMRPVFVPRGVIASSLVYYLLLAMLAARAPRVGRVLIVTLAGLIALSTLPFLYSAWGEWRRAPFAEANQFLRAQMQQGDLILHDNKLSFFPMHYHDRALPQEFLADPPGSANDTLARGSQEAMGLFPIKFDQAIGGRSRVWLVIFQIALDQAAEDGRLHENLSRMDAAMRRVQVTPFGDLRIFLYEHR
jgi:4-amino-4-deoxy-L-arabinose transferase-like glycosyltransferase